MKLIPNAKGVLAKAWTIRLILLAGVLSGAEVALQFWMPNWPDGYLAAFSGAISAVALFARVVAQSDLEE